MGRKILATSDMYNWYGPSEVPDGRDICLVRFNDGGLSIVYGESLPGLEGVAMWAVVEPPMQFIRRLDGEAGRR